VTDHELRRGLERALGRRVGPVRRRPHPYVSTHPVEELEVTVTGGDRLQLMLKDLAATCCGELGDRAALLDPRREIEAYLLLGARGAGAPTCVAIAADPQPDHAWVVLEAVDGRPLWQHDDPVPWLAAARWLGRLHGGGVPADARHLVRHDAAHLRRWLPRAVAATPRGALDAVTAVWDESVARLAAWPATFVHGEFYPSNILIAGGDAPRVRPVDWEMAGVGPGVLDLAALVAGRWSAEERERMARAYHGALPGHDRPAWAELADALLQARLHVAVQWLGWSPGWRPPAAHAHDWLGEALALAAELGR
jgi:aminoglycoside phosphotransferase (APT) family kinase protein